MMQSETDVLVVEDEAHMRRFLKTTLVHNGYRVAQAASGSAALDEMGTRQVGIVLLDLGLPDVDGLDLTTTIRKKSDVPIIVLSARDNDLAKIIALDRGANDYVTKPFSAGELLARIRAALRVAARAAQRTSAPTAITTGELEVNLDARVVQLGGNEVALTPTEWDLLAVLVRQAGRVVTHKELLLKVWGPEATKAVQYLRVYMRQLRYKLEKEPAQPRYLVTVPGVGYRFRLES